VSSSEYDEIAQGMEEAQAELERAALEEEVPKKRQTERAQTLKKLSAAQAMLRELERGRRQEGELAGALSQMNKSTKQLLAAISENTKRTNDLFEVSNARLAQLEQEIVTSNDTAFPADPTVLAEGVFLQSQLGGLQGTEDPRPLFKDATPVAITPGIDVLSSTVCTKCPDESAVE
jgi:hypothetical protein